MAAHTAALLSALTPPVSPAAPDGFTVVTERITTGLPHRITLTQELQLVLVVPTGSARAWQDLDPLAVVAHGEPQLTPFAPGVGGAGAPMRAVVRVYVLRNGSVEGVLPLVAALRRRVADAGAGEHGSFLELVALGWDVRVGSLRGSGDFGSFVTFAWRELGRADDAFSAPVPPPRVLMRLPAEPDVEELPSIVLAPPGDFDA